MTILRCSHHGTNRPLPKKVTAITRQFPSVGDLVLTCACLLSYPDHAFGSEVLLALSDGVSQQFSWQTFSDQVPALGKQE